MRIIHFDIDTLRADHLGCYGDQRPPARSWTLSPPTASGSPTRNVPESSFASRPEQPSAAGGSAYTTGSPGTAGTAASPFPRRKRQGLPEPGCRRDLVEQDAGRRHLDRLHQYLSGAPLGLPLPRRLQRVVQPGHSRPRDGRSGRGCSARRERKWAQTPCRQDRFLHVHMWDPSTPYRTPDSFGDPFVGMPTPRWLDEDVRGHHWSLPGSTLGKGDRQWDWALMRCRLKFAAPAAGCRRHDAGAEDVRRVRHRCPLRGSPHRPHPGTAGAAWG